jgi:predicted Rossmann-fold nucleotide-binding protein
MAHRSDPPPAHARNLGTDSPLSGAPSTATTIVNGAEFVAARVTPRGSLENLSHEEVAKLLDRGQGGLYPLLRRCALAVLNSGSYSDDPTELFGKYKDFELRIIQDARGVKLQVDHAPAIAFVDGEMIQGVKEHLFAVLRDIVYIANEVVESNRFDLTDPEGITNAVFCILRNARVLESHAGPDLVVCWGGHSISRDEYDYSKRVGYELGLRGLSVCTGCGPGAMKGPMKGATIGHAKQRIYSGRYIGLTEPGIVAAEPPNPIVNHLVILPDIEKRLEAFIRLGHGIVVFPGGVGTTEEILYLLGILLDPANTQQPMPVVLTGPADSAAYFRQVDAFVGLTMGPEAQARYRIIIDDPAEVARVMAHGLQAVRVHRKSTGDAYNFNWTLSIPHGFQLPFVVSHESVAALRVNFDQPVHDRAIALRRMFSALVAGNIKEAGVRQITERGPYEIHADPLLMEPLDALLKQFVADRRMKLSGDYKPVYRLVS